MSSSICACNELNKNGNFFSLYPYNKQLEEMQSTGNFTEVDVQWKLYPHLQFEERWFRCDKCRKLWRIIEPDPPFLGNWSKVDLVADDPNNNLQNSNPGGHNNDYE